MNSVRRYFSNFFKALKSLLTGMKTTLKIFFRKKTTQCYPENRKKDLYVSPEFRGRLEMIHTPDNHHHCVACGICQMNCPNGSIRVESEMLTDAEGKKTKVLKSYVYDLGRCMFCELCVRTCPHHAIQFTNAFENAVFTRSKLIVTLNHPGSSLLPKPVAPKAAPAVKTPAPTAAPAAQAEKTEGTATTAAPKAEGPASNPANPNTGTSPEPAKAVDTKTTEKNPDTPENDQ